MYIGLLFIGKSIGLFICCVQVVLIVEKMIGRLDDRDVQYACLCFFF